MADETLTSDVTDRLFWDPRVTNAAIAVSAGDGVVTLSGTVGSFGEKREACESAGQVRGVKSVNDELAVRPLSDHRREDTNLRTDLI